MRLAKKVSIAAALILAIAQFVRPARPDQQLPGDGPMESHIPTPPRIATLLQGACYDCHSERTRWPWYANVAPVSWIVANDVREGRSGLDFSYWSTDRAREPTQSQRLRGICYDLEERKMPPRAYALFHPAARLSQRNRDDICGWAEAAADDLRD